MSSRASLSRRSFLRGTAASAVALLASSCAQPTPEIIEKEIPVERIVKETVIVEKQVPVEKVVKETVVVEKEVAVEKVVTATPVPSKYKEAPMLAELVRAGKLPPVDERVPDNPLVLAMVEGVGKYGGKIRRGFKGPSDGAGISKLLQNPLTKFNLDLSLRPNVCESWETNADASEWTWRLRPGTKWSDGAPFTSQDMAYFWEHHLGNEELKAGRPAEVRTGQTMSELATPDDFTAIVKFAAPRPLSGFENARPAAEPWLPGHYLEQYNPDFADKSKLDKMASDAGLKDWIELYNDRQSLFGNLDRPSLYAWVFKNSLAEELNILERNPYFWQVDADGQQLPYADVVQHRFFQTNDVFNMWILNGEIDFQARHVDTADLTVLKGGESNGDYLVGLNLGAEHTCLSMNMTCKNERLAKFFQERNVRIAVSYAVDRDTINELVFDGLATPRQYSPIKGSAEYYPKLSDAYLDYDPDKANALLDEAGYSQRDSEGFRVYDDGSGDTITFVIESFAGTGTSHQDHLELVVKYLGDVGIKCTYNLVERALHYERLGANDVEAGWSIWNSLSVLPIVTPAFFIGRHESAPWAWGWSHWLADKTDPNGVEPPAGHWWLKMQDLAAEMGAEVANEKRQEIFFKILDIWVEELPQPGFLGQFPKLVIYKNGLRNYAPGHPDDGFLQNEFFIPTASLYWDDPSQHM